MPLDPLLGAAIAGPLLTAAGAMRTARRSRARAAALEADVRSVWTLTGEGLVELSADGRVVEVSEALRADLGYDTGALLGRRLAGLIHDDDREALLAGLNPLGAHGGFDARMRAADGGWRPMRWRVSVDGERIRATARPPLTAAQRRRAQSTFDAAFAASPIGMAMLTADGVVRRANGALIELVGRDPAGCGLGDLVAEEDAASAREQLARLAAGELAAVTLDLGVRRGDGRPAPARFAVSLVRGADGEPERYVAQVVDASEREDLRERVRFEAEHDALTGVLNRRAFSRVLAHHVAYARRYHREGALVVLDIDGLREVNDTAGASVGDAVLSAVAASLSQRLRETDVIGRIGGDEFGVMLAEIDAIAARRITEDLLSDAAERAGAAVPAGAGTIRLSAGMAIFDEQAVSGEALFAEADMALLEAKDRAPGGAVLYDGGVRTRRAEHRSRRTWAEKLRAGLEADAFLLDAQPIVDVKTGEAVQYELLLRMRDDDGGLIRPNAFLHVAERYGLMRAIDEWVVRRAIALGRARLEAGVPVTLAVNVSGESVTDPAFLPLVVTELMDAPYVGEHLVFEVTERTAVEDIEQARRLMTRLGEFGCRFALDDFGAGHGSFTHLKHLPVDYVKLDGEFTRTLPQDPADREIVAAIVRAARGLGKEVVAECVEDAAILQAVREFGIRLAQGVHVARPARAGELLAIPNLTVPA